MGIAGICGARRSPSGAFTNDDALTGPHAHPNAGNISTICSVVAVALIEALEMRHLPVPPFETKDRIGLCDGKPAFDIIDGAPINLTAMDILACQFAPERRYLLGRKPAHLTLTD